MFKSAMNVSANPCDDFFQFACGKWMAENPIPKTSTRWSQFNLVSGNLTHSIKEILTAPMSVEDIVPVKQSKTFYKSCVDLNTMDERGMKPFMDLLDKFGGWPLISGGNWDGSKFKLEEVTGGLRRELGINVLADIQVARDMKNAERNIIVLDQASFSLPRDMFLDPEKFQSRIDAYRTLIWEVAQLIHEESKNSEAMDAKELKEKIDELVAFESKLAHAAASEEDRVVVDRIYNPFNLDKFQESMGENSKTTLNWKVLLDKIFEGSAEISGDEELIVYQPKYLESLNRILRESKMETVANYVIWNLVSSVLEESTTKMLDIQFNFSKVMRGAKEPQKREERCADFDISSVYYPLGFAVGSKYIEQFFLPEAKQNIEEMVHFLRDGFSELVQSADWLDTLTRDNALEKLKEMKQFIGYPDFLTNSTAVTTFYEGFECREGMHLENFLSLLKWNTKKGLISLRKPAKGDEMDSHPVYVNAMYMPEVNSITFPAGILMPPFYRNKGPSSVNFGGIGVVIGHEITHGFDNQGSQYDKKGNAVDWWTKEIKERFTNKAQCIIDQYSGFSTPQGNVNGQLTAGENIADNGGLREAFKGYRNWIRDRNNGEEELPLPGLEDLSHDQLFFLGYANVWCQNVLPEAQQMLLMTDVHSPGRFRVLGGLQNSESFAKAWNCPRNSYMNPEKKCVVW